MPIDRPWRVLCVIPSQQLRVIERCAEAGLDAYCPMLRTIEVTRRHGPREVVRPLMPGYLFVAIPDKGSRFDLFEPDYGAADHPEPMPADVWAGYVADQAQRVQEPILGCLGFITGPEGPMPVSDDVIQSLRDREAQGEFDLTRKSEDGKFTVARWMRPGAFFQFIEGPFRLFTGTIIKAVNATSLLVSVNIFGRDTKMTVPMDWASRANRGVY